MHARANRREALAVPGPAAVRAAAMAALLAAAVALRAPLIGGGQMDYDEGVYWQSLRALAAGHPLFTSVYSSQPPAFLMLLLPAQVPAGVTLVGARLTVLILALAGIVAVYRTASLLAGPRAGLLAAAALAADPLYFRQSVVLQADGPAVALALVAAALAAEARRRRPRTAAALAGGAGAALAAAVLTKLLAVAAAPALAVLLLAPGPGPRRRTLVAAAAAGGIAASAALLLPFVGAWPELWRQSVGLHLGARSLQLGGLDVPTVLREVPLALLGTAGLVVGARRTPLLAATGGAWLLATALLLLAQHPLWPHHAVALGAPLALLAGGLAAAFPAAAPARTWLAASLALLALAASASSALYVRSIQTPSTDPEPEVAALRSTTAPGDLVVTDDQFAAALADRSTPPELVDTSQVRVASGDLTAAQLQAIADRPGVRAILLSTGRLARLPGLRSWLDEAFPVVQDLGHGRTLRLKPG